MKYPKNSLGQYLKEQRELKGLSIDQVALETNIAKKYIEALENDEYGFFPAEMYITGFLVAYIEILELDRDLVLSMYHRSLHKEQETPLEVFYNIHSSTDSKKYVRISVFVLLGITCFAIIGVILTSFQNYTPRESSSRISSQIILTPETLAENNEISIGLRDTVFVKDNDKEISKIEFLGRDGQKNLIKFRIGQNQYVYKVGDVLNVDTQKTGNNDLTLEIIDITETVVEVAITFTPSNTNAASFFDIAPFRNSIRNTVPIVVLTNVNTFNATVTASRPVWIEYQVDTTSAKQQLLNAGETVRFSFIDGVKLSLGNAGAATITFAEFTNVVRGGIAGESSQSLFYKQTSGNVSTLYRAQLK